MLLFSLSHFSADPSPDTTMQNATGTAIPFEAEVKATLILVAITVIVALSFLGIRTCRGVDRTMTALRFFGYSITIVVWCGAWMAACRLQKVVCGQFTDGANYFVNLMWFFMTILVLSVLKYEANITGVLVAERDPGPSIFRQFQVLHAYLFATPAPPVAGGGPAVCTFVVLANDEVVPPHAFQLQLVAQVSNMLPSCRSLSVPCSLLVAAGSFSSTLITDESSAAAWKLIVFLTTLWIG